jgi:NAD(P)H dehydrogenase (quinone)
MILVTGASGHFGKATIQFLLQRGIPASEVVALVRNENQASDFTEQGVGIAIGDYDDYTSLVKAFKEIDKLLFVSGNDIGKRLAQHENVIKAAKEAGVKHIVYTSFQRKNESDTSPLWVVAQSHIQTENWLKESGIGYTILKNNLYMDFLPGFIGEKVLETGSIYVPAGDGKISAVLRSEMAEAAATILASAITPTSVYEFTNTEAASYDEIGATIAAVTGKAIRYISPSADEYVSTLKQYGLPGEVIGIFAGFAEAQAQGELDTTSTDLTTLLGRKPVSVVDFIREYYTSSAK